MELSPAFTPTHHSHQKLVIPAQFWRTAKISCILLYLINHDIENVTLNTDCSFEICVAEDAHVFIFIAFYYQIITTYARGLFNRLLREKAWDESRVSYWVTRNEKLIRKTLAMPADEQKREIEAAGEKAIFSYNQTDFVKDRVAVEVQFGKYAFVAYDLFVKHLAFYVGDRIDVGIEILPMKAMQSQMSSGVAYYEGEFYNVVRQGRGVPAVPLVLIGIEP